MKKNTSSLLTQLDNKKSQYWTTEKEQKALKLFHDAAKRVPAYKDFLKKHGVKHEKIKTFKDFQDVPLTSKTNYLREYPLEALCWNGDLSAPLVFTSTSGSTGAPFYFCRNSELDWQYSIMQEFFFQHKNSKGPTLVIVCFGMGVWIGGLITYQAIQLMSERGGHPVSLLTPGINKEEIFNALKNIAPHFSQVVLCGYPPFIKDIIDEAPSRGVNFKKISLRLIFAAESFTETFRHYLAKRTRINNEAIDTMNIYGSADIGAMAFETPLSIHLRKIALGNKRIFKELFSGTKKTPTLAQYIPSFICFEEVEQQLILTGKNAMPLIRYAIGDNGGVMDFNKMKSILSAHSVVLENELRNAKISGFSAELPFVYIYERNDFATKLYGVLIFPEHIKSALLDRSLQKYLTGKFSMITRFDKRHNQYLEINIELKPKVLPSDTLEKRTSNAIVLNLRKRSAEYENNYRQAAKQVTPRIIFWPYEDHTYFRPGVKQQWTKKNIT